ncbi:MAG: formylglycine-generating enzyme family protein [Proteobacteria bacterium]|nr:formylglycine-generating enzyme family protein [Pseudomonadota bacterium]
MSAAILLLLAGCTAAPAPRAHATMQCLDAARLDDQRIISAGRVNRGDVAFRPEERVGGRGNVAAFSIDTHEVTNRQFAVFIAATRYVTAAERTDADGQRHGAAVFDTHRHMWIVDRSADWRHPQGQGSSIEGRDFFPVVQVSYEDAVTYAHWHGRRLPTENEWERAARGDAPAPAALHAEAFAQDGAPRANTWQGVFPVVDQGADGFAGLAPVGCFPANTNGLYDMVGNVWEWTSDWFAYDAAPVTEGYAREHDPQHIAEHVIKGGSYLCSDNFCSRFRSGSRQPSDPSEGMSHVGFRTVGDAP